MIKNVEKMNMLNRIWEIEEKDIQKSGVFWNMMSSGINSVVSLFLLLIVTRSVGVAEAGIFSLGFSTAQMMLTIGNYGMRNFQVTDLNNKYSMRIYLSSRIVTNIVMMVVAVVFVLIEGYNWEKGIITLLLCLLKATDAMDDIYGGFYQKRGRLDISGKLMSIRIIFYVGIFIFILLISQNLILACFGAVIASSVSLSVLVWSTRVIFKLENPELNIGKINSLLKECLPLCISMFLLLYMGNAPKYAIDNCLSDTLQACYNYLFMPCFIINLFVNFALQPLLVRLSQSWLHKKYKKFLILCAAILGGASVLAFFVVVVGRLIGCQLLSIVFGVQLTQYKNVFTILLIGGAFYAFSIIGQVILTVMRKQIYLFLGFGIASGMAFVISKPLVQRWELVGAGYAYMIAAGTLFLIQMIMIMYFYRNGRKYEEN